MPVKFSVIIPTYIRPKALRDLLSDLNIIAEKRGDVEVIVFNDSRDVETEGVCRKEYGFVLRHLFSEEKSNSAVSRNLAMEKATGEFVVFLDDDVRLEKDFFENVEKYLDECDAFSFRMELPNKTKSAGLITNFFESKYPGKIIPFLGYFSSGFDKVYNNKITVDHLPGATMVFKSSLLNDVKFDERIGEGTGYLDDADFSYSVKKNSGINLCHISWHSVLHLQVSSGGNRQLDEKEWYYYYQNHKVYFFKKHFSYFYLPSIIIFSFLESVLRSILSKKNLLFVYVSATINAFKK